MANVYQRAESRNHEQHKFLEPAHSSKCGFEQWRSDYQRSRFARQITRDEFEFGRRRHKTGGRR